MLKYLIPIFILANIANSISVIEIVNNPKTCQFCVGLISEVSNQLQKNVTKQSIIDNLQTNICAGLGFMKEPCNDFVLNNTDKIVKNLGQNQTPKYICSQLISFVTQENFVCQEKDKAMEPLKPLELFKRAADWIQQVEQRHRSKDWMPTQRVQMQRRVNDVTLCDLCKNLVNEVHDFVAQNLTTKQIENLLENNICNKVALIQKECNELVEDNVPTILNLLAQNVDPDVVCVTFCNQTRHEQIISLLSVFDPTRTTEAQCELCVFNAELTRMTLKQYPTDKQQIKYLYEQIQSLFPVNLRNQWFPYLNEDEEVFTQLIRSNLDSRTTCKSVKQCTDRTRVRYSEDYPDYSIKSIQITEWINPSELTKQNIENPSKFCQICLDIAAKMGANDTALCDFLCKGNQSLTHIETVPQVNTDPSQLCQMCLDLVSKLGGLNATQICAPFCNKDRYSFESKPNEVLPTQRVKNNKPVCEVCTNIITQIQNFVNQNLTSQQIIDLVENACKPVPIVAKVCNSFIETNVPIIMDLIKKNVDPNIICEGFCNSTRTEQTIGLGFDFDSSRINQVQCEVCVFNAELTRMTLKQDTTDRRHQIRNLFEQIRRLFPETLRNLWFSYLNENDAVFTELIANNVDSETTCRSVRQCVGSTFTQYVVPYRSFELFEKQPQCCIWCGSRCCKYC